MLGAQEAGDIIEFTSSKTYNIATLRGGDGNDSITVIGTTAGTIFNGISFNGNAGDDTLDLDVDATHPSIFYGSTVHGGQGEDTISVAALNGTIVNGNKDDDTINVLTVATVASEVAVSSIYGGQGNDVINIGETGTAHTITATGISGNDGDDTIEVAAGTVLTNATISGNSGDDNITIQNINVSSVGITLSGGEGNDIIDASSVGDVDLFITSAAGNNELTGGGGADTINAGGGNDELIGGDGADTINAGDGSDIITGGNHADLMTGGAGVDVFVQIGTSSVAAASTTIVNNQILNGKNMTLTNGVDIITDFTSGTDQISTGLSGATLINTTNVAGALTANANYFLYGTFFGDVFTIDSTVTASTANVATLAIIDAQNAQINAQQGLVVLQGIARVTSADFIA